MIAEQKHRWFSSDQCDMQIDECATCGITRSRYKDFGGDFLYFSKEADCALNDDPGCVKSDAGVGLYERVIEALARAEVIADTICAGDPGYEAKKLEIEARRKKRSE